VARLFISHSAANNAAAIALCDWLAEQGFDDVFLEIDPDRGVVAGERWHEALKAAATAARLCSAFSRERGSPPRGVKPSTGPQGF